MGYALARAAEMRGARVTLVSGPVSIAPPNNVAVIPVRSAADMADAVGRAFGEADIVIKSAAVADYTPKSVSDHKLKKTDAPLCIDFDRTQDILATLTPKKRHQVMVGFAAETQQLETFARQKLEAKGLDMIVGNLVGSDDSGFEADTNRVSFYFKDGTDESVDLMPKHDLAHLILDRVKNMLPPS